jgi:hypothetical protein
LLTNCRQTPERRPSGTPHSLVRLGCSATGESRAHGAPSEECAECAKLGHAREHAHHERTHQDHFHDRHPQEAIRDERIDLELNLTQGVLAADRDKEQVSQKLVAVDENGEEVPAS